MRNYKETICSSLQAFEYLKRIQVGRIVTSELGIYHIISGAFGAFERKTLKEIGYWDIGPGLDGDLTQKLRKHADILLPTKNWSILNWLSNMESVVFDCFLNFLWLWYIIKLAIS